MADHRDTNHDGKVSFMEKVKDKLHMGHKDDTYTTTTHTTTTTHNTTHTGTGLHTTTGYTTTTAGYTTGTTGYNTGVPLTGAVPVVGALPVVGAVPVGTGVGLHDSRDLNRDGHVSAGERLVAGATHSGSTHTHATHGSTIGTHAVHGSAIGTTTSTVGEEARLRLHEEQLAISKREVGAGEVGIHKRVHEENVVHTVPVRREEVTVERRPLSGIADPHAHIANQDETLRVALHREEVVTEKRVVPTEEVIVRKKQVTDHQQVGATLRSEHLETVQTGVTTGAYATGTGLTGTGAYATGTGLHNTTGLHDVRDTNHDGHVSVGEKLKGATHR